MPKNDITKKLIIGAAIVGLLLILLVSLSLAYAGRDVTLLSERSVHLSVNGHTVQIPLSQDGMTYDLPCLTSEGDNEFTLVNDPAAKVTIEKRNVANGKKTKLSVDRLTSSNKLTMVVKNGKDVRTIYLRTLSSRLPALTATGESAQEGDYYVTDFAAPNMYILNAQGEVIWYVALDPEIVGNVRFVDFKKHTFEDGKIRYSYHQTDPDFNSFSADGYMPGKRIILDEKFQIIENDDDEEGITLGDGAHSKSGDPVDGHDFILLSDNHYIVEGYIYEAVDDIPGSTVKDVKVIGAVIQEIKDGEVVFEWCTTDYPELYGLNDTGAKYDGTAENAPDYFHLNSMTVDPKDNNLIISSRNTSTIYKIDRESGDILWQLSGKGDEFGLSAEQKTSNQHYVRITEDGTITIFDNGVANEKTRAVALTLDEKTKKITSYESYEVPGHFSLVCGSVEKLSDQIYLFGWGGNSSGNELLTEYDFKTGKKQLEVTLKGDGIIGSYRVQKFIEEESTK